MRLAHPRGGERVGQGHAEVDVVQDDLQDGRRDRGSAGRADAEHRLPVGERDDRPHAGPWLLAAGGQVRVRGPGCWRGEVEVGHLVVEQEPVAGHGLAAAAEEVDRVGVGDDVAPLVDGDDVVGVASFRRGLLGGLGRAAGVGRVRVAGGDRRDERLVVDQAAPSGPSSGTSPAPVQLTSRSSREATAAMSRVATAGSL